MKDTDKKMFFFLSFVINRTEIISIRQYRLYWLQLLYIAVIIDNFISDVDERS